MIATSAELDLYLASFEELEAQRRGEPAWLGRMRRAAIDRFTELGFPTTRNEEWRFTSVAPIAKTEFQLAPQTATSISAAELSSLPLADLGCARLVFVNGWFSPELSTLDSLPSGVKVTSLAAGGDLVEEHLGRYARYEDQAFVALNTAFVRDGALIEVGKGVVAGKPIQILYVTAADRPVVMHPRNLILADRDSQAAFVERYVAVSDEAYFTNAVTEIVVGENANVEHYKIQQERVNAFHVASLNIQQERASVFSSHNVSLGGALVRNDLYGVLNAEGAEAALNGLYIVTGSQHIDNHTTMDHAKPHCSSREVYKGILDGRASAVFNGKIIVRPDAQKTDAKQTNKNLLLSEDATINTKPQLEIHADDVKCTHGATIGQLGEELVFYLRSRGIGHQDARRLLTYAFATDVTDRMKVESIRTSLDELLLAWLQKGSGHKELV
jgi:Fe-S cluster assembly protein SufD